MNTLPIRTTKWIGLCVALTATLSVAAPSAVAQPDIRRAAARCDVRVDEDTSTLESLDGETSIRLDQIDRDAATPVYLSPDARIKVELWKGNRPDPTDLSTDILDDLAAASLARAHVGGPSEITETINFDDIPPATTDDLIAMRVTVDGRAASLSVSDAHGAMHCTRASAQGGDSQQVRLHDGTQFDFPAQLSMSPSDWTKFNHKTFIPAATVSAGVCGTFKGDNRSWNSGYRDGSSRTIAAFSINWDTQSVNTVRTVSPTVKTNGQTSTASASGIAFLPKGKSSKSLSMEIAHSVRNPLCSLAGPIQYNAQVQLFRNSGVSLYTSGVKAPHHEAYAYRHSGEMKTLGRQATKHLICLSVNCGKFTMRSS